MARHTLSVLVNNHMGVLSRVSGLFSRRGFNIESLAVGETEDPNYSRMTIVTSDVDDETYNQIKTQLGKLMDVVKIHEADKVDSVVRELALIKIDSKNDKRSQILELVNIFRGHVLDVTSDTLMIEITGDSSKISAIISMLNEFGVKEVIRTGAIAIARGSSELKK
ncbi:MAG: acetolactate synthase small subunit [Acholeplasmatales bacterium]|nr:acetolactate synthase small subunit [Acholeplasmatales bacterium]